MSSHTRMLRGARLLAALVLAGCASAAKLPVAAGTGPHPTLPKQEHALIPTVHVVDAQGWPPNATPTAADGLTVTAFARGLEPPRWRHGLPHAAGLVARAKPP